MKKPEYMMNLSLSQPMLYLDESDGYEEKFIFKHAIKVAESFDDAVHKEIIGIAREKGFTSLLLLNKEDIAEALAKQIPKKPNKIEWGYECPCCNADEFYLIYDCQKDGKYNHCAKCGQALDWSDTE